MITDVFSLAGTTSDELRWTDEPRQRFAHCPARDVGPNELATLAALLGVGAGNDLMSGFSLLAGESQQSPWVVSIPTTLLEVIATLDDGEIDLIADRWGHPGMLDTTKPPAVGPTYLRRLARFLREHEGPFALYIHTDTGDRTIEG